VFFLQLGYLAALALIAGLYFHGSWIHRNTLGTVPIAVPWWGAVGAVVLSLDGVFQHRRHWLRTFAYWHWARPFIGAIMASFSVLVFQAGVLAVGKDLKPAPGVANTQNLFYYVVAFIVGFREETARTLIKRVGDVILGPGETGSSSSSSAPPTTIASLQPASGPAGTTVTVTGTGLGKVEGITVAGAEVTITPGSDSSFTFQVPENGGGIVSVVFTLEDGTQLTEQFTYA
jgi:hypothetical protein